MRKIILVLLLFALIIFPLYAGGNRWTSKPPIGSTIDWSHPLSKGLVGCWLMNEGGGGIIKDLIGNNNGSFSGATSPSWKRSSKGIALDFDGSDDLVDCGSKDLILKEYTPFSIVSLVNPDGLGGNNLGRIVNRGGINLWVESTTKVSFQIAGTSNLNKITDNGAFVLKKDTLITVTTDGTSTASGTHIYSNDRENTYSVSSNGAGLTNTAGQTTYIGNISAGTRSWDGKIYFLFLFNRVLSPSEIRQLYQDPYCFIKPPTMWSMFSTAVVAARRFFIFD